MADAVSSATFFRFLPGEGLGSWKSFPDAGFLLNLCYCFPIRKKHDFLFFASNKKSPPGWRAFPGLTYSRGVSSEAAGASTDSTGSELSSSVPAVSVSSGSPDCLSSAIRSLLVSMAALEAVIRSQAAA